MLLAGADAILRGRLDARPGEPLGRRLASFLPHLLTCGLIYGAAMGSFGGFAGDRLLLVLYSAVKVPLLLLVTFLVSLPSFFVLNTLLGLRGDFAYVLRALVATQAALTIVLCSLAPLTLLWYRSTDNYNLAILFNALMFGIASFAAQWLLRRYYRPLVERSAKHRRLLRLWLVIFAFVGIQMGWVLRPFIGNPDRPAQFIREGAWGNAYVEVFRIVGRTMR